MINKLSGKYYCKTFVLFLVLLMSVSVALAADCVWRPVLTSNGGIFYTLYEADGKVYLGTHNKIMVSSDDGDSFNTYDDAPNQVIYLNMISKKFIAGTLDGTYLLSDSEGDVKWTKVFEPSPYTTTSQMLAIVGSYLYSADGYDEIIYKPLFVGKSTTGNLTAKLPAASSQIFDLEANGNTLWAAVKPGYKLYKLIAPDSQWVATSQIGSHIALIDAVRFKGSTIYASTTNSDFSGSLYYSEDNGASWDMFPAQIPNAKKYSDMLMGSSESYIVVNIEDPQYGQKAKVYKQRGSGWQEYGLGLKSVGGKDILKTTAGSLLVIGSGPGDGDNVNKCKPNLAPVPDAGDDIIVFKGEMVILDGSKTSDPEGDKITYHWEQPGAIMTALKDEATATPSFVAKNPGNYIFQLSATDEYGAESTTSDQVIVTVVDGETFYLTVEGTVDHHSWNLGKDYSLGDAYFSSVKQDFDFPFKVYSDSYFVQNAPVEVGMYNIFSSKPSQSFVFYTVDSFDKVAIFMRTGSGFGLNGDTVTVKIRRGSLDGEVVAEASKFVEKSLVPHWEEFVFEAPVEAQDNPPANPPADDGSDQGSGPSGGGSNGGSSGDDDNGPTIQCTSSSSCSGGLVCKNLKCVSCAKDSECKSGYKCTSGKCVKITTKASSASGASTDDKSSEASVSDGSAEPAESPKACTESSECSASEACKDGVCAALECEADQIVFNHKCTDSGTINLASFDFAKFRNWLISALVLMLLLVMLIVGVVFGVKYKNRQEGEVAESTSGNEVSKAEAKTASTKAAKAKSRRK